MPIYEYECSSCGHSLEAIQKIADAVLENCPECKKDSLKKLQSLTSFQLKGSGWYKDGYNGKSNVNNSPSNKKETKEKPATDSKKKTKVS